MLSAAMEGWSCGIPTLVARGHVVSYPRTRRRPMYSQNHSRKPLFTRTSKVKTMSQTNSRPNLESGHAETRHPATDKKLRRLAVLSLASCVLTLSVLAVLARGQGFPGTQAPAAKGPWMDKSLSADQRADLLIGQMTLEEKISLLHGSGRRAG